MKTKNLFFASLLVTSTFFTACNSDGPCVSAKGGLTTETRDEGTFTKIDLSLPADVYVYEDSTLELPSIEIEAPSNLMEHITTKVHGATLEIDSRKCFKNTKDITIWVRLPKLQGAYINGSGNITGETPFNTDNLDLEINGSGDISLEAYASSKITTQIDGSGNIELWGTCTKETVEINGSGNIKAKNMIAEDCQVNINGSGDCHVHANNDFDVTINGSGNVYYNGDPATVKISINGSGDVIKE